MVSALPLTNFPRGRPNVKLVDALLKTQDNNRVRNFGKELEETTSFSNKFLTPDTLKDVSPRAFRAAFIKCMLPDILSARWEEENYDLVRGVSMLTNQPIGGGLL